MNLTVAITIQGTDGKLIGPNNGCPILYVRGTDDNDDAYNALTSEEFFEYLLKNKCFNSLDEYTNTKIYASWYTDEENTRSMNTTLQDAWPFDYLHEYDDKLPVLAWTSLYKGLKYLFELSRPDLKMENPEDIDNIENSIPFVSNIYNKIKEKYQEKLSVDTFIQGINSYLQQRQEFSLSEYNINYIVEKLTNILKNQE